MKPSLPRRPSTPMLCDASGPATRPSPNVSGRSNGSRTLRGLARTSVSPLASVRRWGIRRDAYPPSRALGIFPVRIQAAALAEETGGSTLRSPRRAVEPPTPAEGAGQKYLTSGTWNIIAATIQEGMVTDQGSIASLRLEP